MSNNETVFRNFSFIEKNIAKIAFLNQMEYLNLIQKSNRLSIDFELNCNIS